MKPFIKKFEIRWSDLDVNRHVANSAYINLMIHTRMSYLISHGFGYREMVKLNIGPVIFYDHIHYFREVLPGATVYVTLELRGLSKDGMFFEFVHNIYAEDGSHHLNAELMGGFVDLQARKMTALPENLINQAFDELGRTDDFRWLTKEDTRKHQKNPQDRPDLFK